MGNCRCICFRSTINCRIESGSGGTAGPIITVTTVLDHGFNEGTPIKIDGVGVPDNVNDYNISTKVQSIVNSKTLHIFTICST